MARKPNYGQQRAERNRAKQAKQEAKLREREAAAAARRQGEVAEPLEGAETSATSAQDDGPKPA